MREREREREKNLESLLFKFRTFFVAAFRNDVNEIVRQNEWDAFSSNAEFALEVSEKMTEVNMQKLKNANRLYTAKPVHFAN